MNNVVPAVKRPLYAGVCFSGILFAALAFFSFISAANNWPLFYSKLGWSLVVSLIGFCIYRNGAISKYRSVLFILIAFFFFLEFKFFRFFSLSTTASPYCHIAQAPTLVNFIQNQFLAISSGDWKTWGLLTLGFLWLLILFTLGGGICSWVCFYGGIDEAFSKLLRKPLIKLNIRGTWRDFPLAFLIFLSIVSFLQGLPVFCSWFCPFKLTGAFWETQPFVRNAQMAFFLLSLVVFLIVLPAVSKKRTFCSLICPFGALVSVCGKASPYRLTIDKHKCTRCGKCRNACPSFAVEGEEKQDYKISSYCNRCGLCIDVCPADAIHMSAANSLSGVAFPLRPHWQITIQDIFIFMALLMTGVISGSFVPITVLHIIGIR